MSKENAKPQIRFKRFSEDWERRKLEQVYKKIRNAFVGTATPYYVDNGHFYLESNNVKDGQINCTSEIFINDEFYERQKENWLHTGDLVMVQSGHVGHTAVIPENLDNTAAHALIVIANPNKKICPFFVNYQFQAPRTKDSIDNITTGNTIKHILASEMKKFEIQVPKYNEQKKIGKYFKNLDHLITLHQCKYDKLHNIKKSMLEKMFPQNGSNVPEIRFKGFTGDWEQCKLGDIGSVSMCHRIFKEQTSENGDIPFYKIGTFGGKADAYISKELFEEYKSKYPYPQKGDILISASGSIGRTIEFKGENEYFQDSNIVWFNHDERLENSFLKCFYTVVKWGGIEGSTIKRLYNDNILNTIISLPTVQEQRKIGTYFETLDRLLTLQQRKLEKLKNIKQSMLEKMFV